MGYKEGHRGENVFRLVLNKKGIPYTYVDEWYDFEVHRHKVEVKSTKLSIINGQGEYKSGRYEFTSPDNRDKQHEENVWVCFVVRHFEQYIIQGFTKARNLEKKRYISIPRVRALRHKLLTLEEWLMLIEK